MRNPSAPRRVGPPKRSRAPFAILGLLALAAFSAGCDGEGGEPFLNSPPNTRISLGPPEQADTSYLVDVFWFGFDDDGEVSHYEIAWETPDTWLGPIFSTDSLFVLDASDTCCVDPLPEYGTILPDSVYQQYHTIYVRSVDDDGAPDPTPAVRSFNAKTIAPYTEINFGPDNLQQWGTNVQFRWTGNDDDGVVVSYEWILTNGLEYQNEFGDLPTIPELVAWVDTLTYRPLPGGGYSDERVWKATTADSVVILGVAPIAGSIHFFAVRSIDNAGAKERILNTGDNYRRFSTVVELDGPRLTLISNIAGSWTTGGSEGVRDVFAGEGIRFRWTGTPGTSESAIAGFSYAVEDTLRWEPFSLNSKEWPVQVLPNPPEELWFPQVGPHNFYLRAIDFAGFLRILVAQLNVLGGPRSHPQNERYILAVLDGFPDTIIQNGVFPTFYSAVERSMIQYFLDGYNFQIWQTNGSLKPPIQLLDFASSVIWLLSANVFDGDGAILENVHNSRRDPNFLPSYIRSGGNFFLLGIQPVNALRYFDNPDIGAPLFQFQFPVDFSRTLLDTTLVAHWATTELGIQRIDGTVRNEEGEPVIALARSQITTGPNPYPDLAFDPLSVQNGNILGGFRFYDVGVIPTSSAEVIYEHSETGQSVGIRRLTSPGVNGNTVYLALHPYFLQKSGFRTLLRAVLTDFGEIPLP